MPEGSEVFSQEKQPYNFNYLFNLTGGELFPPVFNFKIMTVTKRPQTFQKKSTPPGKTSYGPDINTAQGVKEFNKDKMYTQGFRTLINASTTTNVTIQLNSPGKFLLGISIIPVSGTNADIADCQIQLIVNNNNILLNVGAPNMNPNFVQGILYFPTPQPLMGNDSISINVIKNNAANVTIVGNIFYVPQ